MTPRDKIVYKSLESWEMTEFKFMGYNLNLNRDEINHFKPKSDPERGWTRGTMWATYPT